MKNSENTTARCPFYSSHNKCLIKCQGIAGTARTGLFFYAEGQRRRWMKKYCDSMQYGDCPLAWILDPGGE